MNIQWVGSPNYAPDRRDNVSKVIVHWMVGTLASTDSKFQDASANVSAHYGIEDEKIHQYVLEKDRAFHAMSANEFSIGIEHSAAPGRPASDKTYQTSIELCADICHRYGLTEEDIEPHSKYVNTQCPGTLDLDRIKNGVKNLLKGESMETFNLDTMRIIAAACWKWDGHDGRPDAHKGEADTVLTKNWVNENVPLTNDNFRKAAFSSQEASDGFGITDDLYRRLAELQKPAKPTNTDAQKKLDQIKEILK